MNEWKILDLKNPPDLTKEYEWEVFSKDSYSGDVWEEVEEPDVPTIVYEALQWETEFRYREIKKRTIDDIAMMKANKRRDQISEFVSTKEILEDVVSEYKLGVIEGFIAGRSSEYDDVEIEE